MKLIKSNTTVVVVIFLFYFEKLSMMATVQHARRVHCRFTKPESVSCSLAAKTIPYLLRHSDRLCGLSWNNFF